MSYEKESTAPTFKYLIELEGISVAAFQECAGLTLEREVETYAEGGLNEYVHILPGRMGGGAKGNITLKRGVTESHALWNWYQKGVQDGNVKQVNASILLINLAGEVVRRWDFTNVIPIKWIGPDLKADSDQIAVETLELGIRGDSLAAIQRALSEEGSFLDNNENNKKSDKAEAEVDRQLLAQKVFTLLKKDLQVKQERLGRGYFS